MDWLGVIFPKRCLICERWGSFLCSACRKKLKPFPFGICAECGKSSGGGKTHTNCLKKESLDGLVAVWQYRKAAKEAVKGLKYRFIQGLVSELAGLVIKEIENKPEQEFSKFLHFLSQKPILLPIPLHQSRQRWRGFNQAEVLAKELAKARQLGFSAKILERVRPTQPQVELKGKERRENLKGAFELNKSLLRLGEKALKNKSFLLIDDVFTSGATLREATKVLKEGGAGKVWALTLAR